ncbi:MAG: diaminopimelate decarboxylase [Planctomycetota bacterium]|nr:MAG: diaminopimelate decarboxylase [Planctomycetota bacterium]
MRTGFHYRDGQLFADELPVASIVERVGTPLYIYSAGALREGHERLARAFAALDPLLCFAVKANANLAVLRLLADRGAGFDVVSGGELARALRAGAAPDRIVFAGVGKRDDEIAAALEAGILCFNVESVSELERIEALATARSVRARLALRVNPEVDPRTHAHIATGTRGAKFGLSRAAIARAAERCRASEALELVGLHAHIGSQIFEPAPYLDALERLLALWDALRADGHPLRLLNLGGGFGVRYGEGPPLDLEALARGYAERIGQRALRLVLEPGRSIAARAGLLVGRVLHVKRSGGRRVVVTDTGMHHLIRPALYGAYHTVWPVRADSPPESAGSAALEPADVVGPICESADVLARERPLPPLARGDLLACFEAGAYAATMASTYNGHPLPPELLVDGERLRCVRRRQRLEDLLALECDDEIALQPGPSAAAAAQARS